MKTPIILSAVLVALTPALADIGMSGVMTSGTPPTSGDPTGGLLPADRSAWNNWKMAGLVSVGGIPNRTTQCGSTVTPSGGDDTSAIQAAVNACAAGDFVLLSVGTFNIAINNWVVINKSITVRGSGPCAGTSGYGNHNVGAYPTTPSMTGCTLVNETGGSTCCGTLTSGTNLFLLGKHKGHVWESTTSNLAVDGAAGASTIQVANTAGFAAGQIVVVSETAGMAFEPTWIWSDVATEQWSAPDYLLGERITNEATCTVDSPHFCNGGNTPPVIAPANIPAECGYQIGFDQGPSVGTPYECDRYSNELKQIASVGVGACPGTGCTITFDSPLTEAYRTSHTAHVGLLYWGDDGLGTTALQYAGLENMTLQGAAAPDGSVNVVFCEYCWVKNVENTVFTGGSVRFMYSLRSQLEGGYDHYGAYPIDGGAGYNWMLEYASSEILIENSISMLNDKVIVARSAGAGSVVAYNYLDDGFDAVSGYFSTESGLNASHWLGSHHVLFEGNQAWQIDNDDTWGPSPFLTSFRNYVPGFRVRFTNYIAGVVTDDINDLPGPGGPNLAYCYENCVHGMGPSVLNYFQSYIGNVIGTAGHVSDWTFHTTAGGAGIWKTGYNGQESHVDGEVWSTTAGASACVSPTGDACPLIRLSNYDYLTNSVNDPSNPTVPNSFFLASAPSYFSAGSGYVWPWVNSQGSTKVAAGPTTSSCTTNVGGPCSGLPAKARIDNGTPFVQP